MSLQKLVASFFLFLVLYVVFSAGLFIAWPNFTVLQGVFACMVTAIIALLVVVVPVVMIEKWKTNKELTQLIASTRTYIETLERSRTFVAVDVPGLHLERGEFAIRHDRANLKEFRRASVSGGLGTRVRIGKIPIYIGGWKSTPMDELRDVGTGYLVLTNLRLMFLGARTLTISFDHLLTCEQQNTGLVISESRSKSPHVFFLENPGLWCFLVNYLAKNSP